MSTSTTIIMAIIIICSKRNIMSDSNSNFEKNEIWTVY